MTVPRPRFLAPAARVGDGHTDRTTNKTTGVRVTTYELAVLDAVNIASTIHREKQRYQATAAQIAETLRTDPQLVEDHGRCARLTDQAVQNYLVRLAGGRRAVRTFGPLVQRIGTRHGVALWALTPMGAQVLGA